MVRQLVEPPGLTQHFDPGERIFYIVECKRSAHADNGKRALALRRSTCSPRLTCSVWLLIEWATHGFRTTIQDMGIDPRGLHVLMPEQFLNSANIVTGFQ